MPKINAATVAEHSAERRASLIAAAVAELGANPKTTPSLGTVGARVGMSRSSVYHYFDSADALLLAVIEDTFPRWSRRFQDAYREATSPRGSIHVYIRENLALVADGEHALARSLSTVAAVDVIEQHASVFHDQLIAPLTEALTELGIDNPAIVSELINAMVLSAAKRVEGGAAVEVMTQSVLDLVDPFIDQATTQLS